MVNNRVWEIDLLRTLAIIFMVAFHIVVDLNKLVGININYLSGFWSCLFSLSFIVIIFAKREILLLWNC